MYIDWTYIVLVLPAMLFAMWASSRVNSTFRKYKNTRTSRGLTGAQAARWVLDRNGLSNVPIEHISGSLTDHYDPSANVVRLSDDVYGSTSTVAIGVACHEVGHAIQHATNYAPVKIRTAIVPITNLGAKLSVPLTYSVLSSRLRRGVRYDRSIICCSAVRPCDDIPARHPPDGVQRFIKGAQNHRGDESFAGRGVQAGKAGAFGRGNDLCCRPCRVACSAHEISYYCRRKEK